MNKTNDKRTFYFISPRADGLTDVFLRPIVRVYSGENGAKEYDCAARVVRGIAPWDGMEEDIRKNFDAWCREGDEIDL